MNVTSYPIAFASALDVVMDGLDLGQAYSDRTECSFFAVESHIIYERELLAGDPFVVTFQLLASDRKRIHYLQRMYQTQAGYLAATNEQLLIHVNLATRRAQELSDEQLAGLDAVLGHHLSLARPHQVGRTIGMKRA